MSYFAIETDGRVTSEDVVAYTARVLQDQLTMFVRFEDEIPQPSASALGQAAPAEESNVNQLEPSPAEEGGRAGAVGRSAS